MAALGDRLGARPGPSVDPKPWKLRRHTDSGNWWCVLAAETRSELLPLAKPWDQITWGPDYVEYIPPEGPQPFRGLGKCVPPYGYRVDANGPNVVKSRTKMRQRS